MDDLLHSFIEVAGLAVGDVAVILAIYFYIQGKRKIQLSFSMQQTQLLGGARRVLPVEVRILYKNNEITNLINKCHIMEFWK
jgi:hypothetical protein